MLFQICMGSGACVRVNINFWGLSIFIDGIAEDKGKVRGLCGNYDTYPENDFISPAGDPQPCPTRLCPQYTNLWKVTPGEDLFDTIPEHIEHDDNTTELCQCRETDDIRTIQCGPF